MDILGNLFSKAKHWSTQVVPFNIMDVIVCQQLPKLPVHASTCQCWCLHILGQSYSHELKTWPWWHRYHSGFKFFLLSLYSSFFIIASFHHYLIQLLLLVLLSALLVTLHARYIYPVWECSENESKHANMKITNMKSISPWKSIKISYIVILASILFRDLYFSPIWGQKK